MEPELQQAPQGPDRRMRDRVGRRTEHERQLAAAQALAHVGNWEWDIPSNRLIWSAEMCRIHGVDPQTFIATFETHLERVHPDDRERARGEIERAIRACAPFRFEGRITRPDGRIRALRFDGEVIGDGRGNALRLIGVCQDITEYRAVMEALRESEERFRLLVEGVQDYAIFMLDPQGCVVSWNAGAVRIKGYSASEILGRHFSLFYPPEDIERGVPDEVLGQAATAGAWEGEGWRLRKDGSRFWASVLITALRDGAGILRGFAKITRDITDRRRADELLSRQRQLLETVLGQAAEAIVACDARGRMLFVNAAARRLAGLDPNGAALDMTLSAWGEARDAEGHPIPADALPVAKALRGESIVGREMRMVRADGSAYDVLSSATPLTGNEGGIIGAVATFTDITPRKTHEAAMQLMTHRLRLLSMKLLETQEAERRHIARELHDEIGQSLTALKFSLQATHRLSDDRSLSHACQNMIGQVDTLLDQVRNLSLDLRPALLDDLGLTAALRWYIDRQSKRAGLPIHFHDGTRDASIPQAVATVCFRIAQEALTNAVRHAQAGKIAVTLRLHQRELELEVADNGQGFEVEAMRRRAVQGASFGLLGMRERADLLGGSLWIDSHPGRGTTVRARLPLTAVPAAHPSAEGRGGP